MTIKITLGGSTKRTSDFLAAMQKPETLYAGLEALAQRGVEALRQATPKDTGETSNAWGYEIRVKGQACTISWLNTNKAGDTHVAILLQYGHGTGTGGYVQGRDYINGALQPIFDEIANSVWEKVQKA